MLEWLIVGGGLHGVVFARALQRYAGLVPSSLMIIDRNSTLLAEWERNTQRCGMSYLRSPGAHSLEPDFGDLFSFARKGGFDPATHLLGRYQRPSLTLFTEHSKEVIRRGELESRLKSANVERLSRNGNAWSVWTTDGSIYEARAVLLATGPGRPTSAPQWSSDLPRDVCGHVFDPVWEPSTGANRTVVIGGGATGVQLAVRLAGLGAEVELVVEDLPVVEQFDSDPCFIGQRCGARFEKAGPVERRRMITAARRPGTIPADVAAALGRAAGCGDLRLVVDRVVAARAENGVATLELASGARLNADRVTLATGFHWDVEEACGLVDDPLPVDPDGRPRISPWLEWGERLFVTGRLAEGEIGPPAPNLIGAHNAAKRVMAWMKGKSATPVRGWSHYR